MHVEITFLPTRHRFKHNVVGFESFRATSLSFSKDFLLWPFSRSLTVITMLKSEWISRVNFCLTELSDQQNVCCERSALSVKMYAELSFLRGCFYGVLYYVVRCVSSRGRPSERCDVAWDAIPPDLFYLEG